MARKICLVQYDGVISELRVGDSITNYDRGNILVSPLVHYQGQALPMIGADDFGSVSVSGITRI